MSSPTSSPNCNILVDRLEQLYQTHMRNIAEIPRTNLFQLSQSFNNYMNFAQRLTDYQPFGDITTEDDNNRDSKLEDFEPLVPEIRERTSPGNQIHKMIFSGRGICFRSNKEMERFNNFMEEMPRFSESNVLYWKLMFNEHIELSDVASLTESQISTMRVCALVRYKLELDTRWVNQ